jgi:hypothetical protein
MWLLVGILTLGVLYMWRINCAMKAVPDEARQLSPNRWTVEEIKAAYKKNMETPIDMTKHLPPKQSRRYVIVGGTGMPRIIYKSPRFNHDIRERLTNCRPRGSMDCQPSPSPRRRP